MKWNVFEAENWLSRFRCLRSIGNSRRLLLLSDGECSGGRYRKNKKNERVEQKILIFL